MGKMIFNTIYELFIKLFMYIQPSERLDYAIMNPHAGEVSWPRSPNRDRQGHHGR